MTVGKTIDNFERIEKLLSFKDEDTFYHLQIIRRRKDHPELAAANRTIKSYFIDRQGKLNEIRDEVVSLCEMFGARAYININPKSYRKCTLQCIADMAKRAADGDFKKIYKQWNSVVGYIRPLDKDDVRWIIDVDFPMMEHIDKVIEEKLLDIWFDMIIKNPKFAKSLEGKIQGVPSADIEWSETNKEMVKQEILKPYFIIDRIPTKNGYHLITRPFEMVKFIEYFEHKIDVHKNNPTILYIPIIKKFEGDFEEVLR